MTDLLTIRPAIADDIAAIDALLARSYPVLLRPDYPPSVMVTAVPLISHAQPRLVTCGTYFVIEGREGAILGAGGWTSAPPPGQASRAGAARSANVRHVVTDHRMTRRGIGRRLMEHLIATARAAGFGVLDCLSTRTAVPFYAALGFTQQGPLEIDLRPGIVFPAIRMYRPL